MTDPAPAEGVAPADGAGGASRPPEARARPAGPGTLLRFLIGDPDAIHAIATAPGTLATGLVFVLTAGLAREYDGQDLLHEPWHALGPIPASLAASLLLAVLVFMGVETRAGTEKPPSFARFYAAFLRCFWATAPLAWAYAVPWERLLGPAEAMEANLWTLGAVAAWRVILITRVVSVLTGAGFAAGLLLVMLFADVLAIALIQLLPFPIIDVMGGVRLSPARQVLKGTAFLTGFFGCLSAPLWLGGTIVVLAKRVPAWRAAPLEPSAVPCRGLAALAVASLVFFSALLPFAQPEQLRRRAVERLFEKGDARAALAELSRLEPRDFPPHWQPPDGRSLLETLEAVLADAGVAPWVRARYAARLGERLDPGAGFRWRDLSLDELARLVSVVEKLADPQLARSAAQGLARLGERDAERRPLLERLEKIAGAVPAKR